MRERAVEATGLSPLTARLPALRCTDWVPEVRAGALRRLAEAGRELDDRPGGRALRPAGASAHNLLGQDT